MANKGTCEKHGEFILSEGCPQCIADKKTFAGAISELETGQPAEVPNPAAETALALRPGEDVEVRGYFKESMRLLEYAEARVIATAEDNKVATDDLAAISKLKKAMEGKKREYLDPLKAQAEAIRETYSSLMDPVFRADKITREKMLAFDVEQRRIRQEQEEINRKRQEVAEAEMRLKGELSESVNLVEVAPEPVKSVSTEMGTASKMMVRKWGITDFAQVPDEYKVIDAGKVTKLVKAGIGAIPGIRIWEEPTLRVTTR